MDRATTRTRATTGRSSNGLLAARSFTVGISRLLFMSFSTVSAAPISILGHNHDDEPEAADGASLWVLYVASAVLVLLGGAFAGLTIALMGQDGIYLQVVSRDHAEPQQKRAKQVYDLLQKGKHWVLVTLLLSNVIVNETLPVVLDRCLGGGVAAVVGSTFLIVIFGEVLPQSVCVRYGLQIGGYMSKPVLLLMYLMAPIAWPTAKLLDWILGEDHGTVYKKSGLKTLVTLHKSLGNVSERLNQDEVTIISAVLDLKEKPVEKVMTPMSDVFVMAEDTVLDEKTMDMILSAGYSRVPIHEPGNPTNFVGMLLVKILITYDPEDGKLVRDFPLATLPETRPETSCLDIVNFFQEGKSHMVLVSEYPGEDHGALGVVTLEDVIEELIGEEIIDESDVYIDVHKAIRRLAPAPKARVQRWASDSQAPPVAKGSDDTIAVETDDTLEGQEARHKRLDSVSAQSDAPVLSSSPMAATFMMRRSSAGLDGQMVQSTVPVRANFEEMRQHLRHLGPSNPANNPKGTRSMTVKIKHGHVCGMPARAGSLAGEVIEEAPHQYGNDYDVDGDETTRLLPPQISGKDGIQALRETYGSINSDNAQVKASGNGRPSIPVEDTNLVGKTTQTQSAGVSSRGDLLDNHVLESPVSDDSVRSLPSDLSNPTPKRSYVRSGSITENVIESRGVRKVILETTSSNEDEEAFVVPKPGSSPSHSQKMEPQNRTSALGLLFSSREPEVDDDGEEEEEREDGTGVAEGAAGSSQQLKAPGRKKNRRKKRKGGRS